MPIPCRAGRTEMMQSDYKYKTDLSLVLGQCKLDKPTDRKNLSKTASLLRNRMPPDSASFCFPSFTYPGVTGVL